MECVSFNNITFENGFIARVTAFYNNDHLEEKVIFRLPSETEWSMLPGVEYTGKMIFYLVAVMTLKKLAGVKTGIAEQRHMQLEKNYHTSVTQLPVCNKFDYP